MNQINLYLFHLNLIRRVGDPNVGCHSGLVLAGSEAEARVMAATTRDEAFPPADGWNIADLKVEEVERHLIERAAREMLGWSPPQSAGQTQ